MSVKARRIVSMKMEYANNPSFDISGDEDLAVYLNVLHQLHLEYREDDSGWGIVSATVEDLEDAIDDDELELDKDTTARLKADVAWAKEHNRTSVDYHCF